jgi:hypothetical protein
MRQIQPLDIWSNGETKTAVCLRLYISYDDLDSRAVFQYALCDVDDRTIYDGQVLVDGQTYVDWGASADSTSEAYTSAATQLNLTII